MFEMAFFYGDFSMLPSMQELLENVEGTTTAEEISTWNDNPNLL